MSQGGGWMSGLCPWKHHPFADTYMLRQPWMPDRDRKQLETIKRLLHTGKSIALCGPSGSGKTSLVHGLISDLDKNSYRTVLIPYAVIRATVREIAVYYKRAEGVILSPFLCSIC